MAEVKRWEDFTEEEILEANIEKYANNDIVQFYEDFEDSKYSYAEYEVVFSLILDILASKLTHPVRAVDMCGGTGKAAFVLKSCNMECDVTLVDVSDQMLEVARKKAAKEHLTGINIVNSDAFAFFDSDEEYDLIIFSSAIHHFKEPVKLLSTAAERLSANGMLLIIAEPNRLVTSKRYKFVKFLMSNRGAKIIKLRMTLQSIFTSRNNEIAAAEEEFDVAEYQAHLGIDDKKLVKDMVNTGLYPLVHFRYPAGETNLTKIMPYLGLYWAFILILCKSTVTDNYDESKKLKKYIKNELPFKIDFCR